MKMAAEERGPETGTEQTIAEFRKTTTARVVMLTVLIAGIACGLVWFWYRSLEVLLAATGAAALALLPLAFEARRKIVFTPGYFVFNASAGEFGRIPLRNIAEVAETTVVHLVGFMPIIVPAARLTLTDSRIRTIPVDFPGRSEILARLRQSSRSRESV